MGAYGAWDTISRHLDLFAVALAICGGVDIKQASRPKNIAIYNAHGTDDNVVPISRLSDIVNVLRNTGNNRIVYEGRNEQHNE